MGGGNWTREKFASYSKSMGRSLDSSGRIAGNYSNQEMFKTRYLDELLDPKNVVRECCDSEEHPTTVPVILALDVTGSMGQAAVEVAKQLNVLMTNLYDKVKDVEFLVMGIGDLAYDRAPIQASQFESDIRIAEQLDKVYFEFGGGGNSYESYSAAWYFGAHNTKLDCWNRGKRGIIITMGDETLNPYLPKSTLNEVLGCTEQDDVETKDVYNDVKDKYDVYHINVEHGQHFRFTEEEVAKSFKEIIGEQNYQTVKLEDVAKTIENIVTDFSKAGNGVKVTSEGISW